MQTACNTPHTPNSLPSINDPSLDAVQTARAPEPSHEEIMAALESETQSLPTFPDTLEGHIAALLPEDRARKLMRCRKGGFIFKYHDGLRAWRPCFPCQLAIACAACAMDQADEQFGKYRNLNSYIQYHHFTRITVPLQLDDYESPKPAYDLLMRFLRKYLPTSPTVAKIKPSSDIVEILYCAAISDDLTALIRRHYPRSRVRRHCQSNFIRELHQVVDADTFSTPEAAAKADAKYLKTHLLRTQGLSQEERKNLSIMAAIRDKFSDSTPDSANPPSPSGEKLYHRTSSGKLMPVPACPCGCGAAPTHFGHGKYLKDDSSDIHWVQIEAVTEEQRIHEANLLKTSMVMIQ